MFINYCKKVFRNNVILSKIRVILFRQCYRKRNSEAIENGGIAESNREILVPEFLIVYWGRLLEINKYWKPQILQRNSIVAKSVIFRKHAKYSGFS